MESTNFIKRKLIFCLLFKARILKIFKRKNMLKKIVLATLLALGLNAAPLAVDSVVDNLKIKDQNEVEKVIDTNVKTILFASDKSTSDMLRDYLLPLNKKENILEKNSAVYVADISGMPSLISKFIALPKMKKYPFSVLLLDDTNKDNSVKEDRKIIVYSLENRKVVKIDKISTKEELASIIKYIKFPMTKIFESCSLK